MPASREILLCRARFAKKLHRYNDLYKIMKSIGEAGITLNKKECRLYNLAYFYLLRPLRAGIFKFPKLFELFRGSWDKMALITEYRKKLEKEIIEICSEAVNTIDHILMPRVEGDIRAKLFYMKMRADMTRYMIDFCEGPRKSRLLKETKDMYREATIICQKELNPLNTLRLRIMVNFVKFMALFLDMKEEAKMMGLALVDDALEELEEIPVPKRKRKVLDAIQMVKDNCTAMETYFREEINNDELYLKTYVYETALEQVRNARMIEAEEIEKFSTRGLTLVQIMEEGKNKYQPQINQVEIKMHDHLVHYYTKDISPVPSDVSSSNSKENLKMKKPNKDSKKTESSEFMLQKFGKPAGIGLMPPDGIIPFEIDDDETQRINDKNERDTQKLKEAAIQYLADKLASEALLAAQAAGAASMAIFAVPEPKKKKDWAGPADDDDDDLESEHEEHSSTGESESDHEWDEILFKTELPPQHDFSEIFTYKPQEYLDIVKRQKGLKVEKSCVPDHVYYFNDSSEEEEEEEEEKESEQEVEDEKSEEIPQHEEIQVEEQPEPETSSDQTDSDDTSSDSDDSDEPATYQEYMPARRTTTRFVRPSVFSATRGAPLIPPSGNVTVQPSQVIATAAAASSTTKSNHTTGKDMSAQVLYERKERS